MQATSEQIIEAARQLSTEEIEKLSEWVHQQQIVRYKANEQSLKVKDEVRKFNLALKWIVEHKQKYLGQWVCLDGDELNSYGSNAIEVHNEAKTKGIKAPFLERIIDEPEFYSGEIQMCK